MRNKYFPLVCIVLVLMLAVPVSAEETAMGHYTTQTYPGSWVQNWSSWYWRGNNGTYLKNAFLDYSGHTYFLKSTGEMSIAWEQIDNNWYYFENWGGMRRNTFFEYRDHIYYVDENGVMAVGWKQINGNWYYFYSWGGMYQNIFFEHLNYTYYVDENGVMAVGWKRIDGNWYYFYPWGGMYRNTFFEYLNHTYYVDENGIMLTGWNTISGNTYYFESWGGGAKGWNLLIRQDTAYYDAYEQAYWNYFSDEGRLLTDSDAVGCSEGFNTFTDKRNATIVNNHAYTYSSQNGNSFSEQIRAGISLWENATDLSFSENTMGVNLIFSIGSSLPSRPDYTVNGITYVYYYVDDLGEIETGPSEAEMDWVYTNIILNPNSNANVTGVTVAHEIGHSLGLSHQISDTTSIMSSPAWGRNTATLSNVDINNYLHLY